MIVKEWLWSPWVHGPSRRCRCQLWTWRLWSFGRGCRGARNVCTDTEGATKTRVLWLTVTRHNGCPSPCWMQISVHDMHDASLELQGLKGPNMVQTFRVWFYLILLWKLTYGEMKLLKTSENIPKLYGCEMSRNRRNLAWACWSHVSAASCRMDLKQMLQIATDCYSVLEKCLILFRSF